MKPDIFCSSTEFGLFFFLLICNWKSFIKKLKKTCPCAVVERQERVAISIDAGRNAWFVSQKKMKTLHLVPPQARHYVSDVRAAM